ncbi:hypothetical protein ONZ51_g4940 [Trametes cubensis]|uniref:Uncharacterized protein n=1 Tax=Trametes cubensis TaxID=1111947 RepID=A0AAD7XCI8_9APHY|nr:hypothetical protein ONZ51_g4940 [Trametes cubensis]
MPSIHAETTDGVSLDVSGCPISALTLDPLRHYTGQLRDLAATSLSLKEFDTVQAFLKATMPRLEQLRVSVDNPADDGQTHQVPEPIDLPPTRFPALRTVVLEGVGTSIGPAVASRLWRLVITNKPNKHQGLALLPFINCISHFKCLEELKLTNCFALATVDGCRAREPFAATRLMSVTIEDHPPIISRILSALIIPARARVQLVGNMRGATPEQCFTAFSAMLPDDKRCLPVLQNLSSLDVYHPPEGCYFAAKTESGDVLDLEVTTDALDKPSLKPIRGELFKRMVHGVRGIFPDSPLERLVFVGDVGYVPAEIWASSLALFPRLRELEVDDVELRASPSEVISALMKPSSMQPGAPPICPQLESLALYGDISAISLLGDLYKCLSWRQERGGGKTRLRKLAVELYCDNDMSGPLLEKYEVALARVAEKKSVELIVVPGRRQR